MNTAPYFARCVNETPSSLQVVGFIHPQLINVLPTKASEIRCTASLASFVSFNSSFVLHPMPDQEAASHECSRSVQIPRKYQMEHQLHRGIANCKLGSLIRAIFYFSSCCPGWSHASALSTEQKCYRCVEAEHAEARSRSKEFELAALQQR